MLKSMFADNFLHSDRNIDSRNDAVSMHHRVRLIRDDVACQMRSLHATCYAKLQKNM